MLACSVSLAVACTDSAYPSGEVVAVSLGLQRGATPAAELLVDVAGERFRTPARPMGGRPTQIRTLRGGAVPVGVRLLSAARDTLASVTFVHVLAPQYNHWISAYVGRVRLHSMCSGALVVAPLTRASGDSLFVNYGRLAVGSIC